MRARTASLLGFVLAALASASSGRRADAIHSAGPDVPEPFDPSVALRDPTPHPAYGPNVTAALARRHLPRRQLRRVQHRGG